MVALAPALLACALNIHEGGQIISVHPSTITAIVAGESGGNPLAVNINGMARQPPQPHTLADAIAETTAAIGLGYSVDIGLAQINSRNLPALGYSIADAFDPCHSIRGGAIILAGGYARATARLGPGQGALLSALSAYNTGSLTRGFQNGYVARILGVSGTVLVPKLLDPPTHPPPVKPSPLTADTVVYEREAINVRID